MSVLSAIMFPCSRNRVVHDLADKLIRFCLDKKCILAVISVQDILRLDNSARTNKPGFIDDYNWTWRMKRFDELEAKIPELKELLARSKR